MLLKHPFNKHRHSDSNCNQLFSVDCFDVYMNAIFDESLSLILFNSHSIIGKGHY